MAEIVKKAKAPAKPRAATSTTDETAATKPKTVKAKTATAKSATKKVAEKAAPRVPTHDEIATLAAKYWAERGHAHGHHEQDWLRAERELKEKAS